MAVVPESKCIYCPYCNSDKIIGKTTLYRLYCYCYDCGKLFLSEKIK